MSGWFFNKKGSNLTGIGIFKTVQTPSGTSPVATSTTDTLTLLAGTGITITGNAAADSVTITATGGGSNWSTSGNSGTTAGTNFLGTTDNVDLVIKTNNTETGRFISGDGFALTRDSLAATTVSAMLLRNTTAATAGVPVQVSPSLFWRSNGRRTSGGGSSRTVDFTSYVVPSTGTNEALGEWRLDYSLNGATAARGLQYFSNFSDGVAVGLFRSNGLVEITANNSSTIDTLQNLDIVNPSGSKVHFTHTFGSTIRYGISSDTNGAIEYKAAGISPFHSFYGGTSITVQTLLAQFYSGGLYTSLNGFFGSKVTAGLADTAAKSTLNVYGSASYKGTLVTSSSYTVGEHVFHLVDPTNANVCTGTPTSCNTYTNSTDCGNHTGVGCSWSTYNCSTYNGTDSGTCTTGHTGCTWESLSCSSANNTDQTTCEALDDAYGGTCVWDTTTCPAFTNTATCNGQAGCTASTASCSAFDGMSEATCEFNGDCTWTGADCHAFDGTDQATCETGHTGCTWNGGGNTCDGVYDEASTCGGTYLTSCTGNLCGGSYNSGNCTGTWGECLGTALCSNLGSSGTCAAESGCSWIQGCTLTLPASTSHNSSNVARAYYFKQIGTGTTTIQPASETDNGFYQYGSTLKLYKPGDDVVVYEHNVTASCSAFVTSGTCTPTGCVWTAKVCGDNATEVDCNADSGNGCTWNAGVPACEGTYTGSAGTCSNNYTASKYWYTWGYNVTQYAEKTANYTLTGYDDIIVCKTNSFDITFPSAVLYPYKRWTVKNVGSGTTITLKTTSSQTIDGNASGTLTLATNETIVVFSDGANLKIE